MIRQFVAWIVVTVFAVSARAQVVEFTNKQSWQATVAGNYNTIDFTGFADGTPINTQYENLGITFVGSAFIFASAGFVNDGWGIHGSGGLRFAFDDPQFWVAIDHPGVTQLQLLNRGQIVYTSSFFFQGGLGNFAGLVSAIPFDEVYIFKPPPFENQVAVDDLYWGAPIPTPGALGVFAAVALVARRRRRG